MILFFNKKPDLLKAIVKKQVWVAGYTTKHGTYVAAHNATVNVSTDHDDHVVASGNGKMYEKKAHAHLSKQSEHNALSVEHQAGNILHLSNAMQKEASTTSDINTLKNKIIAGGKPTKGEWLAFSGATDSQRKAVIDKISEAGKLDHYESLAGTHDKKPVAETEASQESKKTEDKKENSELETSKDNIVLNEGNGIVLNKLYKQFSAVKTQKQHEKWLEDVKNTKFGTYGSMPFLDVLEKFEPKFKNEIDKEGFINGAKKALGIKISKPSLKEFQQDYQKDKDNIIGGDAHLDAVKKVADLGKKASEAGYKNPADDPEFMKFFNAAGSTPKELALIDGWVDAKNEADKVAVTPVKKEETRHAGILNAIASLPSGNYKKQAHSELSGHSDWGNWNDKEKHYKVMALYHEKQSAANAAANITKFKKTILAGGIPSTGMMTAIMGLSDKKRRAMLSSLADQVGGIDKLKAILEKANSKAKKEAASEKQKPVKEQVTKEATNNEPDKKVDDTGPNDGDTKEGADGTLVFKDGRWHKQGENKPTAKKLPSIEDYLALTGMSKEEQKAKIKAYVAVHGLEAINELHKKAFAQAEEDLKKPQAEKVKPEPVEKSPVPASFNVGDAVAHDNLKNLSPGTVVQLYYEGKPWKQALIGGNNVWLSKKKGDGFYKEPMQYQQLVSFYSSKDYSDAQPTIVAAGSGDWLSDAQKNAINALHGVNDKYGKVSNVYRVGKKLTVVGDISDSTSLYWVDELGGFGKGLSAFQLNSIGSGDYQLINTKSAVNPVESAVVTDQAATVDESEQFDVSDNALEIKEFTHSKKGHQVFSVPLGKKLNSEDYKAVNELAKDSGGFYSKFKSDGAVPGFHFKTKEDANEFANLVGEFMAAGEPEIDDTAPEKTLEETISDALDAAVGYGLTESTKEFVNKYLSKHSGGLFGAAKELESIYMIDEANVIKNIAYEIGVPKPEVIEKKASINKLIREAGSASSAYSVAQQYIADNGESVETYDAVLTALDMQGYEKLANDLYQEMTADLKEKSSMKLAGSASISDNGKQAPDGTTANYTNALSYTKKKGVWFSDDDGESTALTGNIAASLELISGHMPSKTWMGSKNSNHKEAVIEIAEDVGVSVTASLNKIFPVTGNGFPSEGDTKTINGVTYILKNGRWHKLGEEDKGVKSLADLGIPDLSNASNKGPWVNYLEELKKSADGSAGKNISVTVSKKKISIKDKATGKASSLYNPVYYNNMGDDNLKKLQYILSLKTLSGLSLTASQQAVADVLAEKGFPVHEAAGGKKVAKKQANKKAKEKQGTAQAYENKQEGIPNLSVGDVNSIEETVIDNWKKVGDKAGSNEGGFYEDSDGEKWYCKFPKTGDHVKNELLAAKIYEAIGIKVPTVKSVTMNGKPGIASKIIDGLKADKEALKSSADMMAGFAADCWLANWDSVGLGYDNAQVADDGSVYRVDPGGALLYRAQGDPKGDNFSRYVTEFDTMRDASKNPQSASVFKNITPDQLNDSVKNVLFLKDSAIMALCKAYGPGTSLQRNGLAEKLIARKQDIAKMFPEIAKEAEPKLTFKLKDAPNFKEWNGPGQGLSSKAHLNDQNQSLANEMFELAKGKKEAELNSFEFQPVSVDDGSPVGAMQPISQHKSSHIVSYWKDLLKDLKTPYESMDHLKDVIIHTAGNTFEKIISLLPDVKILGNAAVKIGRYALLGVVDGNPFADWNANIEELSQANGKVSTKKLYDETRKKFDALSELKQKAIKQYTGSAYTSMNNPATGVGSHGNTDYAIAGFDEIAVPLDEGTILSRRFSFGNSSDLNKFLESEGGVVKDFGMISTSTRPSAWSGSVHLRITCGQGVKGAYVAYDPHGGGNAISVNAGEDEIVLPYGSKFFITKVHKKGTSFKDAHGHWGQYANDVVDVIALPNM